MTRRSQQESLRGSRRRKISVAYNAISEGSDEDSDDSDQDLQDVLLVDLPHDGNPTPECNRQDVTWAPGVRVAHSVRTGALQRAVSWVGSWRESTRSQPRNNQSHSLGSNNEGSRSVEPSEPGGSWDRQTRNPHHLKKSNVVYSNSEVSDDGQNSNGEVGVELVTLAATDVYTDGRDSDSPSSSSSHSSQSESQAETRGDASKNHSPNARVQVHGVTHNYNYDPRAALDGGYHTWFNVSRAPDNLQAPAGRGLDRDHDYNTGNSSVQGGDVKKRKRGVSISDLPTSENYEFSSSEIAPAEQPWEWGVGQPAPWCGGGGGGVGGGGGGGGGWNRKRNIPTLDFNHAQTPPRVGDWHLYQVHPTRARGQATPKRVKEVLIELSTPVSSVLGLEVKRQGVNFGRRLLWWSAWVILGHWCGTSLVRWTTPVPPLIGLGDLFVGLAWMIVMLGLSGGDLTRQVIVVVWVLGISAVATWYTWTHVGEFDIDTPQRTEPLIAVFGALLLGGTVMFVQLVFGMGCSRPSTNGTFYTDTPYDSPRVGRPAELRHQPWSRSHRRAEPRPGLEVLPEMTTFWHTGDSALVAWPGRKHLLVHMGLDPRSARREYSSRSGRRQFLLSQKLGARFVACASSVWKAIGWICAVGSGLGHCLTCYVFWCPTHASSPSSDRPDSRKRKRRRRRSSHRYHDECTDNHVRVNLTTSAKRRRVVCFRGRSFAGRIAGKVFRATVVRPVTVCVGCCKSGARVTRWVGTRCGCRKCKEENTEKETGPTRRRTSVPATEAEKIVARLNQSPEEQAAEVRAREEQKSKALADDRRRLHQSPRERERLALEQRQARVPCCTLWRGLVLSVLGGVQVTAWVALNLWVLVMWWPGAGIWAGGQVPPDAPPPVSPTLPPWYLLHQRDSNDVLPPPTLALWPGWWCILHPCLQWSAAWVFVRWTGPLLAYSQGRLHPTNCEYDRHLWQAACPFAVTAQFFLLAPGTASQFVVQLTVPPAVSIGLCRLARRSELKMDNSAVLSLLVRRYHLLAQGVALAVVWCVPPGHGIILSGYERVARLWLILLVYAGQVVVHVYTGDHDLTSRLVGAQGRGRISLVAAATWLSVLALSLAVLMWPTARPSGV